MTEQLPAAQRLLARARAGDGDAFGELVEPFRRELQLHCYQILGSVQDAEDMLQETLLAAWRGLGQFEGRGTLRSWLYRIATNKCLNALRGSRRSGSRPRYQPEVPLPEPTRSGEPLWLEPYPDLLLGELPDTAPGPAARYEARESVSLAFVTALQHLPPRQRATLILRDVLGFRAAETAGILGCSLDSVNGSLKRARAGIANHLPPGGRERSPVPGSARERDVVARFADAFTRGDVDGIVALLTDDAWLSMPPLPFEYQGRATTAHFLWAISFRSGTREFRLIATRANGQPAFGCYLVAPIARAHGLIVLTLAGDRITAITRFLDNSVLSRFGLPRTLLRRGIFLPPARAEPLQEPRAHDPADPDVPANAGQDDDGKGDDDDLGNPRYHAERLQPVARVAAVAGNRDAAGQDVACRGAQADEPAESPSRWRRPGQQPQPGGRRRGSEQAEPGRQPDGAAELAPDLQGVDDTDDDEPDRCDRPDSGIRGQDRPLREDVLWGGVPRCRRTQWARGTGHARILPCGAR